MSLEEASSFLTTFSTSYNEDALWMQYILKHYISKKKLQQAIECLECVHCVAGDIMLNGVVCTVNEVVADHETKLQALLQQCRDVGIQIGSVPMFPGTYVPRYRCSPNLCSPVPMFPGTYVPRYRCSLVFVL